MNFYRALRATVLAWVAVLALLVAGEAGAVGVPSSWLNYDADDNQIIRFDTDGNQIDAHLASVRRIGNTYYMWGESYGCGWTWQINGARHWCGFSVYTSPDMQHWTYQGKLFDPVAWQGNCDVNGCFRPKVIYNQSTSKYVLWFNNTSLASGYTVMTSDSPIGPFTNATTPALGLSSINGYGDHDLFVDDDGTGWIVYTRFLANLNHVLATEKLNATYTDSSHTGAQDLTILASSSNFPAFGVEAPLLFKRSGIYYLLFAPTCPYCGGTPTSYSMSASLGPTNTWTAPVQINANTCNGQPSWVAQIPNYEAGSSGYFFGADQFQGGTADHQVTGELNQSMARSYVAPLSFDASGHIQPFNCVRSININLQYGSPGSDLTVPDQDQSSSVSPSSYTSSCQIWSNNALVMQTFKPGKTGYLNYVWMTAYQHLRGTGQTDGPNAPLQIDIYALDTNLNPMGLPLASRTIHQDSISWSARNVKIDLGLYVVQGLNYGIVLKSAATTGCYGIMVSASNPYAGGSVRTQIGGSTTWNNYPQQDYKFVTGNITSLPVPSPLALVNSGSNLCMTIDPNMNAQGASALQVVCRQLSYGSWEPGMRADGSDSGPFVLGANGYCLDVAFASTTPGTQAVSGTCTGSKSQQWTMTPNAGGTTYVIKNGYGLCLEGLPSNLIVQQTCNGSAAQNWSVGNATAHIGFGQIGCVGTSSSLNPHGAPLLVTDCNSPAQYARWTYGSGTNGAVLHMADRRGYCMDVAGASTAQGASLVIGTCNTSATQTWSWLGQWLKNGLSNCATVGPNYYLSQFACNSQNPYQLLQWQPL